MRTWFTSDQHFGHENIIKLCERPFSSAEEMDEYMIGQWNSVVDVDDRVVHIGDLYWGRDVAVKRRLRDRLHGRIVLVAGNHDRPQLMLADGLVDEVLPLIHTECIVDSSGKERRIVCCHYPLQEWDQFFRGSIHIHGHCHGNNPGQVKLSGDIKRLDVSVDCHNFLPLCVEDVLRILKIV